MRFFESAYVSIRQHTSAYVSIRQHTSALDLGDEVLREPEVREARHEADLEIDIADLVGGGNQLRQAGE